VPELLIRSGDRWHGYRAAKALAELNWQPLGWTAAMRGAFLMSVAMSVAFGVKQTWVGALRMSAFDPKRTLAVHCGNVFGCCG
jgi:hypothetical protein